MKFHIMRKSDETFNFICLLGPFSYSKQLQNVSPQRKIQETFFHEYFFIVPYKILYYLLIDVISVSSLCGLWDKHVKIKIWPFFSSKAIALTISSKYLEIFTHFQKNIRFLTSKEEGFWEHLHREWWGKLSEISLLKRKHTANQNKGQI